MRFRYSPKRFPYDLVYAREAFIGYRGNLEPGGRLSNADLASQQLSADASRAIFRWQNSGASPCLSKWGYVTAIDAPFILDQGLDHEARMGISLADRHIAGSCQGNHRFFCPRRQLTQARRAALIAWGRLFHDYQVTATAAEDLGRIHLLSLRGRYDECSRRRSPSHIIVLVDTFPQQ